MSSLCAEGIHAYTSGSSWTTSPKLQGPETCCFYKRDLNYRGWKSVQGMQICLFIVLIHPIQWTIALPVGATGPAKQQKKSSCINYLQDRSRSVHSPGVASCILSVQTGWLHRVFFVWHMECTDVFLLCCETRRIFKTILLFEHLLYFINFISLLEHCGVPWTEKRVLWPCYGTAWQSHKVCTLS